MPILTFPAEPWPTLPPLPPEDIMTGAADQTGVCLQDDGTLAVGVWGCSPWTAASGPYPTDEFMVILSGSVTLISAGQRQTFGAGDAFFIPKGLDCQWEQPEPITKVYAIFSPGRPVPGARVTRIAPDTPLVPLLPPAAKLLIGPAPEQRSATAYAEGSGRFSVGVWASTPFTRRAIPYPRAEVMHLLEGEVTLTEAGQPPRTFRAGDTFFVSHGTVVDWHSIVDVRKIYCSIRPEGNA